MKMSTHHNKFCVCERVCLRLPLTTLTYFDLSSILKFDAFWEAINMKVKMCGYQCYGTHSTFGTREYHNNQVENQFRMNQ